MITIKKIASGSSGNCYTISDSKTSLMIECGVSPLYFKNNSDIKLSDISGALISHYHGDHAKYIRQYMDRGVDCFASKKTIEKIDCYGHILNPFKSQSHVLKIGTFEIKSFPLKHDAPGHRGFFIKSGDDRVVYVTDTPKCEYLFPMVTHIMIECNHKRSILDKNENYSNTLKKRVIENHMELEETKKFLTRVMRKKTREIYLIHLSRANSDEELFKREIMELTGKPVFI